MNPAEACAAVSAPLVPHSAPLAPHPSPLILWGAARLAASAPAAAGWLWQGYLAPGAVTLLTSRWKAGKTTLVSVLLARLGAGGALAGLPLAPGRAIVVSEEGPEHWLRRHRQLAFGDHVGWCCRPFHGKPSRADWSAFIDHLARLHDDAPFSLVVVDPLAAFLPGSENDAGSMLEALLPLQRLTARGLAVLLLHHPGKAAAEAGHAARGSGALTGYADILIEMRPCPGATDSDRRRRLWAASRFPETPRQLVVEWSADGADYLARGTFAEEDLAGTWETMHPLFASAAGKLTRAQLRSAWLGAAPHRLSLRRWLEAAVAKGLLRREGTGHRNHPFRYWLPEREQAWRRDPVAAVLELGLPGSDAPAPDEQHDRVCLPDGEPTPQVSGATMPLSVNRC